MLVCWPWVGCLGHASAGEPTIVCCCCPQIIKPVSDGERLEIPPPEQLPGGGFAGLPAYLDLLGRCWAQDPNDRPTFETVIKELRWARLLCSLANTFAARCLRPMPGPQRGFL